MRATIEASTGLLVSQDAERFSELAVFAEERLSVSAGGSLWRVTAGLDELGAARVCKRLAQLALVSQASGPAGGIALHDVIRDFLRAEAGEQRLAELTGMLLDAVAASLPAASPLAPLARARCRWPGGNWAPRIGTSGITSSST